MAWLAVDKDGQECVYIFKPKRGNSQFDAVRMNNCITDFVELPSGSIKKLIGRDLTWEDEPVEI